MSWFRKKKRRPKGSASDLLPNDPNTIIVNGIPFSKQCLGIGHPAAEEQPKSSGVPDWRVDVSAGEIFKSFDTNHDHELDYDEFRKMLETLNINIPAAKSKRYFELCDTKSKGSLNVQEFARVLFAVDPQNPERKVGYRPGTFLTPQDGFFIFAKTMPDPNKDSDDDLDDEDDPKLLDFDDFQDVLQFLGIFMSKEQAATLFMQYDVDQNGTMDYTEFKRMWLRTSDVREELTKRGLTFSKYASTFQLMRKLNQEIEKEEMEEKMAFHQAQEHEDLNKQLQWIDYFVAKAERRGEVELAKAVDLAGQVYVFGGLDRFHGQPAPRDVIDFPRFAELQTLWNHRIHSTTNQSFELAQAERENIDAQLKLEEGHAIEHFELQEYVEPEVDLTSVQMWNRRVFDRPPHLHMSSSEASSSSSLKEKEEEENSLLWPFADLTVAENTAWLWGKRVVHISLGPSVAYALAQDGAIFTWGGRDSLYFQKTRDIVAVSEENSSSRTTTTTTTTPRSTVMKGMRMSMKNKHPSMLRIQEQYRDISKPVRVSAINVSDGLHLLAEYFDLMRKLRKLDTSSDHELNKIIFQYLNYDHMHHSMTRRGIPMPLRLNKLELVKELADVFAFEIQCLSQRAHLHISALEREISKYETKVQLKNFYKLDRLKDEVLEMWKPLLVLRAKVQEEDRMEFQENSETYEEALDELYAAKRHMEVQQREGINHHHHHHHHRHSDAPDFEFQGLTTRGPGRKHQAACFRGESGMSDVSVGGRHVIGIHQTGRLYAWGSSTFGRLGLGHHHVKNTVSKRRPDTTNQDDEVLHQPQWIQVYEDDEKRDHLCRFRSVSAGYGHNAAITIQGQVFVWGSGATGKLGLPFTLLPYEDLEHGYCPVPVHLPFPRAPSSRRQVKIRQISCGPSHSGAVSRSGQLYMWGCNDGFRLGLETLTQKKKPRVKTSARYHAASRDSNENQNLVCQPTLVESLVSVHIIQVSCGVSHTAALSACTNNKNNTSSSSSNTWTGGQVYVCGSTFALGKKFANCAFQCLSRKSPLLPPMKQLSCGSGHTGMVSIHGSVWTFGQNAGGCAGHAHNCTFVPDPKPVKCFYRPSPNLLDDRSVLDAALVKADQSSIYNNSGPSFAFNGDYHNTPVETLREECPFWEIDLGQIVLLEKVRLLVVSPQDDLVVDDEKQPDHAVVVFPCHFLLSSVPFVHGSERSGLYGAKILANASTCFVPSSSSSSEHQQQQQQPPPPADLTWECPPESYGQYFRVQVGTTARLIFHQIELYGHVGQHSVQRPKAERVCCGDLVTMVTVAPVAEPRSTWSSLSWESQGQPSAENGSPSTPRDALERQYLKAKLANRENETILRHFPTYYDLYSKYHRRDETTTMMTSSSESCLNCFPHATCERCQLVQQLEQALAREITSSGDSMSIPGFISNAKHLALDDIRGQAREYFIQQQERRMERLARDLERDEPKKKKKKKKGMLGNVFRRG